MRTKGVEILIAIILGLVIPALLVLMLQDRELEMNSHSENSTTAASDHDRNDKISVLIDDDSVVQIPLEEYVLSVVLSEMPASFETEALKAQAVVARTYALRRVERGGKHVNASVCTHSSCCQGFVAVEDYIADGGKQTNVEKIKDAVLGTAGLVLVYNGELIDATYFSCSGGVTEDAEAVWGREVPYLKSVPSPGEESATHYVDTVQFSTDEFLKKLELEKGQAIKICNLVHTEGGGVARVDICGKTYSGTQLRKLLKLRSTSFYITSVGKTVTITTKGYGHRVGLSQYGADAMAVGGASFEQILMHYYSGVELNPYVLD